jgi:hypothetical protein
VIGADFVELAVAAEQRNSNHKSKITNQQRINDQRSEDQQSLIYRVGDC